jgi:hypothetical protein
MLFSSFEQRDNAMGFCEGDGQPCLVGDTLHPSQVGEYFNEHQTVQWKEIFHWISQRTKQVIEFLRSAIRIMVEQRNGLLF